MLHNRFLSSHHFVDDPFAEYAAEKERLLPLYFVEPRYFSGILGNANRPKSYVVFGPRGSGKSAIRSMIEQYCNDDKYIEDIGGKALCITYDDFSALNLKQLNTITLSDHINEILARGVVILAIEAIHLEENGNPIKDEIKGLLRWYIDEYMSNLSKLELDSTIKSIKNSTEKTRDLLANAINIYNTVVKVLNLQEITPSVPTEIPKNKRDAMSSLHVMETFSRLARNIGYDSIYILVDKIDETNSTGGDSKKAAALVTPLLTNIKLLELENYAFKFFLWDIVRDHFGSELRSDRITMTRTQWTDDDLKKMIQNRILAYSLSRTNFEALFSEKIEYDMLSLVVHFSYGSPRDISRLLSTIIAEAESEASDNDIKIKWSSIEKALMQFSTTRATELYHEEHIMRILKLRSTIFKISDVASIFRITGGQDEDANQTNRARILVEKWKNAGLVEQIEQTTVISNGKRRAANQYKIVDPRVRYHVNRDEVLDTFKKKRV